MSVVFNKDIHSIHYWHLYDLWHKDFASQGMFSIEGYPGLIKI